MGPTADQAAAAAAAPDPPPPATARALAARVAAFGLVFSVLCWVGDALIVGQTQFSTFWPASGLLLGVLLLSPRARWGWYAAAAVAAELLVGLLVGRGVGLSLVLAATDLLEGLAAAVFVQKVAGARPREWRPMRTTLAVVVGGAGLGSAVGSLVATVGYFLVRPEKASGFAGTWLQWWSGDALGVLVVAPLLLAWSTRPRDRSSWTPSRALEAVALAAAGAGVASGIFGPGHLVRLDYGFLLLPVLGWAALRFGLRGASLLGAAIASFSAWATAGWALPSGLPLEQAHTEVQLLLGVSVLAALLFAAALAERADAEAARRESENLFDAFLTHSPVPLFILDGFGRLTAGSRSFLEMMGRLDLRPGETAAQALPDAEGRAAAAEDQALLAGTESVRVDRVIAGRIHDLVKFRIPREGRLPMIGAVAVDVTEQRLAVRSLRLAQVALDRGLSALLFVDPGGVVTYANLAAARLLERPTAELLGRSLWDLDAAFEEERWPADWTRLRAEGSLLLDGRLARPDGRLVEAEVGLTLVAHDGVEVALYAARDLSERRRAESAQRLASVGTLAAGMAHEINNPLTFVAANLAFALDRIGPLRADPRAEEVAHALEDAEEGTRRVARVVRDLKAVSRVEVEERRPIDLAAEVETALKLAQHELRHRARVEVSLGPVPRVEAPEFQLGQVFLNLLVNAGQAVGEGGADRHAIRVTSRTAPDGWAVVEVADDGPGIDEAVRPRIFEPFFTTKPIGAGTGLGLSVCHGIVTGLGGRIEVESAPGAGALFRVLLPPAAPAAAPPPPAPPPPRPEGARARILVIDDEPLIGSTIRRLLSAHEVVALSAPREALDRLSAGEPFDLVLCDLMMPELSGMELWEALAAARPELARRVVFMTGGAFTDRAREFLAAVGQPQLGKPFQPQDLREQVRAWLAAPGALAGPGPSG